VGLVEGCLGEALGEVYVARHFPPEHKAAMERLVADLIEAYRASISSLEWMGGATRERALDKLSRFTPKIGYPDAWRDYSGVVVTPGDLMASGRSVAAFDTVISKGWLSGSAAKAIAKTLQRRQGRRTVSVRSFVVTANKGPLATGQETDARSWGRELADSASSR